MNVGAVILAAGGSSRLGRPKQLLRFHGESLLRRTARAALHAGCSEVLVVLGANADACEREIEGLPVQVVHNATWTEGMASSIRCGVEALSEAAEAVILLVCDQPYVSAPLLQQLIASRDESHTIAASQYANTIGVPALLDRRHFRELLSLRGDAGAKSLLTEHANTVALVPFPGGVVDIDHPRDADELTTDAAGSRDAP